MPPWSLFARTPELSCSGTGDTHGANSVAHTIAVCTDQIEKQGGLTVPVATLAALQSPLQRCVVCDLHPDCCESEGVVGRSPSVRCWLTGLPGRKQACQRVFRIAGWLQGMFHSLRDGSPMRQDQRSSCELHDPPGEPGAGKPHARLEERREEARVWQPGWDPERTRRNCHRILRQVRLPPTLHSAKHSLHSDQAHPCMILATILSLRTLHRIPHVQHIPKLHTAL